MARMGPVTVAAFLLMVPWANRALAHGGRDAVVLAVGLGGTYVNLDGETTGAPSGILQVGVDWGMITVQGVLEGGYRVAAETAEVRLTGELLAVEHFGIQVGIAAVTSGDDRGAEMIFGLAGYLPIPPDKRSAMRIGLTLGWLTRLERVPARSGFFVGGRLLFRHLFGDV